MVGKDFFRRVTVDVTLFVHSLQQVPLLNLLLLCLHFFLLFLLISFYSFWLPSFFLFVLFCLLYYSLSFSLGAEHLLYVARCEVLEIVHRDASGRHFEILSLCNAQLLYFFILLIFNFLQKVILLHHIHSYKFRC